MKPSTTNNSKSDAIRDTGPMNVASYCKTHTTPYPAIDPLSADLSGLSVVITGASKGVGRATAIAFAQAGASKIAICARSDLTDLVSEVKKAAVEAKRKSEPLVVAQSLDITSDKDVSAFADKVGEEFGGSVDLLFNNAGYMATWQPFAETDPSEWWKTYEINIKGLYLASRYFTPLVLKSNSLKTIVNVSSTGAHNISEGASAYQSTKLAVCRLTEHIAADHAEEGLVCLSVHPGAIKTNMGNKMPESLLANLKDEVELPAYWLTWLAREKREWLTARFVSATWDVDELLEKKEDIVKNNKLKFRFVW